MTRPPKVYSGGIPFQVEVGLAYGGEIPNGFEVLRYANRVPLLFDAGSCVTTLAARSIDWKRYRVDDLERTPLILMINVISVHVPYTGTGKQSIASDEDIYNEIRLAIMDVARRLQTYLSGKHRRLSQVKRKKTFQKYVPEIARALSILVGVPEEEAAKYFISFIESRFADIKESTPSEVSENA